jgi:hypothetical protein
MKKVGIILTMLFFINNSSYSENTKIIEIRDKILSLALKNSPKILKVLKEIDKTGLTEEELINLYIELLDYYIGEGGGEILCEKITRLQDKVLPFLIEKKNTPLKPLEKYKNLSYNSIEERNIKIIDMIDKIRKGIVAYAEYPASLKKEVIKELKIIRIFIEDYRREKGKLPENLDILREYAFKEYGYKLKILNPWGQPFKYLPLDMEKYVLEAGSDIR